MSVRSFIWCLIALLCCLGGKMLAQEPGPALEPERRFPGKISDFAVDKLGHLYLHYAGGQLRKLRPNGDSLAVFNNVRRFGRLAALDVNNPLKTLLYYRDFATIVILDRFLNERAVVDLRKSGLPQVRAIGQSYDNNIWVFDELDLRLKKLGDEGRVLDLFTDLRLLFDTVPAPQVIVDEEQQLYLYDPAMGVYIFDYYGGFRNRIPFTGWKDFHVIGTSLLGRDEQWLYRYDLGSLRLQQFPLNQHLRRASRLQLTQGRLYALDEEGLSVYAFPAPATRKP